jgi:hypothetical protein
MTMARISRLFCWSILIMSPPDGPEVCTLVSLDVDAVVVGLMLRTRFAALFSPPPTPVTCNVKVPVATFAGSVTVSAEAKFGVPDGAVKTPLAPAGNPDTAKVTGESKPFKPTTLIWYVAVPPWLAVCDGGLTSILKSGACPIVSMNVVWCDVAPAAPVIVNVYAPGAADAVVVMESIELKLGVPEVGFSVAETPSGAPETDKATLWVVPDSRATVTVEVVLDPGVMVCCAGEAEMEKSNGWTTCTVSRALAWRTTPFAEPMRVIV